MGQVRIVAAVTVASLCVLVAGTGRAQQKTGESLPEWPGWGGPRRNFMVDSGGLADSWPVGGPKRLWSRPLGTGHSSIAVAAGRLYTMYRPPSTGPDRCSEEEAVVALDAADGRTVWEHRYASSNADRIFTAESACGPHVTPLIVGHRLFTVSTNKNLMALDRDTGKLLWSHDFVQEFGVTPRNPLFISVQHGYAPSPLAYKDTVITMAGGPGQGVMAFRQDDGRVVWRTGTYTDIANASPIIISLQGEDQLVVLSADGVHGLDPNNGFSLWNLTLGTWHGANNSTPVWSEKEAWLFVTSAYEGFREGIGGSHVVELTRNGADIEPKELWWDRRFQSHFSNVVRLDSFFVVSDGDYGPTFLVAADARSGEVLWKLRGFAKANFLLVDGSKLLILDEDGDLALATASRDTLKVHARASVLTRVARTAPTLVGTKLYIRDHASIMAIELGTR